MKLENISRIIALFFLLLISSSTLASDLNCASEEIVENSNHVVAVSANDTDGEILISIEINRVYQGLSIHQVLFRLGSGTLELILPLELSGSADRATTWIIGTEEHLARGKIVVLFGSQCPTRVIRELSSAIGK